MAHRGMEGTELNTIYGGADGTKSNRDEAYRILIAFWVKALYIESLIKLATKLRLLYVPTVAPLLPSLCFK